MPEQHNQKDDHQYQAEAAAAFKKKPYMLVETVELISVNLGARRTQSSRSCARSERYQKLTSHGSFDQGHRLHPIPDILVDNDCNEA